MSQIKRVKITTSFVNSNGATETESIWAIQNEKGYVVDNIPFYAENLAVGDIVSTRSVNGILSIDEIIEEGGHTTIQVVFFEQNKVGEIRKQIRAMGYSSELSDLPNYIAIDVEANQKYDLLKNYLDDLEKNEIISYKEACLSH